MHFIEREDGEFRIYTGAIETPRGEGYLAALVVQRLREGGRAEELFRDDALCAGYGWPTPDAALAFAMRKAQGILRAKQPARRPSVASLPDAAKLAFAAGTSVGRRASAARVGVALGV